jgi:hypothetical protein
MVVTMTAGARTKQRWNFPVATRPLSHQGAFSVEEMAVTGWPINTEQKIGLSCDAAWVSFSGARA